MLAIGGIATGVAIAGFSIYRSFAPVDMADALKFFSSCWSCQLFGDILATLSNILPKIYSSIGRVMIPMALGLTAVWLAWTLIAGWLGAKSDGPDMSQPGSAWSMTGKFGGHLVKLALVCGLLAFPLPRFLTTAVIEPVFNIGLSISNLTSHIATDENRYSFESCLVATAIADPAAANPMAAESGAFSPSLRHNMTCQLAGIHQMTALGMTAGWTMMNMAFNYDYMHKFLWHVPIFPNIPLILAGGLILALFFMALLPVPMYFLQIIIKLSMDLVMLPLFLLGWLFEGWKILPNGGAQIKSIINDAIKNTVGIAVFGVFVVFAIMFLNAVFGRLDGVDVLEQALNGGPEGSKILMEGLMLNNGSLITIVLLGIFIAFFMSSIPALMNALFGGIKVPDAAYNKARDNLNAVWKNIKDMWKKAES